MHPSGWDVRWSAVTESADAVLAEQLAEHLADLDLGSAVVGRLCPRCGAADHGRPWARAGGYDVPVSVSRSGEHLVTAIGRPGIRSIGVDVEGTDPPAGWPVATMLAVDEEAADAQALASLWVAKEAILKEAGTGLEMPMTQLVLSSYDGEVIALDAPTGYAAALALRR